MRFRSGAAFLGVCGFTALAAALLHRLGRLTWLSSNWSIQRPPADALATVGRLLALGICYWILISSALYLAATACRLGRLVKAIEWATLPGVRRISQRLTVGSLALATMATPSPLQASETVDPSYIPVPAGWDPPTSASIPTSTVPSTSTTAPTIVTAPPVTPTTDPPTVGQVHDPAGELIIEIKTGDNFWKLAEERLATMLGRNPTDSEVAPYWVEVVEANRKSIRSGDPDLIYPGEKVVLPALNPLNG